jgi:hypothetical protein
VVMLLRENGISFELRDERHAGERIDVCFMGTLRPDQEIAANETVAHDFGILCAPTAFGKTVTAAALIARRGVNTLVLVHRTELMKQWQARLQVFLNVEKGMVGLIGGGKTKPSGKIDIAVMQSLSRVGEVDSLVENYGHVVVDECHHIGAVSFDGILKQAKAKYVLGLTATPIRRDGQQPIIFMQCGPLRHTAKRSASAPHDLEVIPRQRHARIELPPSAGIQDVFGYLAKEARRCHRGTRCTTGGRPACAARHGQAGWGGFRSSASRHVRTCDADFVARNTTTVRRSTTPRTCCQDRGAGDRFCGHRPPGIVADVGETSARISRDGLSDRRPVLIDGRIQHCGEDRLADMRGFAATFELRGALGTMASDSNSRIVN